MTVDRARKKIIVIFLILGCIFCVYYFTPPSMKYQHAVYRVLFYVPLVLASFWFGLNGSIYVCAAVAIFFLPYVVKYWHGFSLEDFHELLEFMLYIAVACILGLLVDKERKEHRALFRAESLAAVGRAVSEIAHDMKTPLMAIGGWTTLVLRGLRGEDPHRIKLEMVVQETARLDSMVKEMLDFSRPSELKLRKISLNELVRETVEVALPMPGNTKVDLKTDLQHSLPPLLLDGPQIKQVVLNLMTNAVQASPPGERVLVSTRVEKHDVVLQVADCGCGIREEDLESVFHPFFSTKKEGTGLGLGIVKKIVEAHQATVSFHPNPERGVTFIVRFPV